jgi:transcriptional regulator with XRE-family HTH domain
MSSAFEEMSMQGQPALGERLRQVRKAKGLGLRELARRVELSPSFMSQIELGKVNPSVRALYAIVSELGISLDQVFAPSTAPATEPVRVQLGRGHVNHLQDVDDSPVGGHVLRRAERPAVELEWGVRWERMTLRNVPGIEFVYNFYPPGSESTPASSLVRHTGTEWGVVLKGQLGLTVGFNEYVLDPGDSTFFDSMVPHRLHNDGDEVVEAIWVVIGREP